MPRANYWSVFLDLCGVVYCWLSLSGIHSAYANLWAFIYHMEIADIDAEMRLIIIINEQALMSFHQAVGLGPTGD